MNNVLILFLCILIIISLIFLQINGNDVNNNLIESYKSEIKNEPILKYNLEYTNIPFIHIYKDKLNYSSQLNNIKKSYSNIIIQDTLENTDLYYTDIYTYNKQFKNHKILTLLSEPKHLLLFSNKNIKLINNEYLRIGYFNEIDKDLLIKVIKSQKNYINLDNYEFIQVNSINCLFDFEGIGEGIGEGVNDNTNLDTCKTKKVDILIYFNTLSNPLLNLIKNNKFNLVSYNTNISKLYTKENEGEGEENNKIIIRADTELSLDESLLRYYLPFYKKKIQIIDKSIDKNLIYNTLVIDTVLFEYNTQPNENLIKEYNKQYLLLLNHINEFLKINYYIQHFDILQISKKWALSKQEHASFKNVMENFDNINFRIDKNKLNIIDKNIVNTMVILSEKNGIIKYRLETTQINNIPMKVGDKLIMDKEELKNHPFYVIEVNDDHIVIENVYRLNLQKRYKCDDSVDIYLLKLDKDIIIKHNLEIGDNVYIENLDIISRVIRMNQNIDDVKEKLETEGIWDKEAHKKIRDSNISYFRGTDKIIDDNLYIRIRKKELNKDINNMYKRFEDDYDRLYQCFEDTNIKTKIECLSNDFNWDRKCIKNEECPFFLKNKNYLNDRGGCVNGYCEFPIGLKRLSQRKYDNQLRNNNYPRCNGCQDLNEEDEIKCCENQKNNSEYSGADYIFENEKRN
tara:strand:- start:268 stop:2319 length:2052 start_codon:yes stop_codon:yes gene_type:complete